MALNGSSKMSVVNANVVEVVLEDNTKQVPRSKVDVGCDAAYYFSDFNLKFGVINSESACAFVDGVKTVGTGVFYIVKTVVTLPFLIVCHN